MSQEIRKRFEAELSKDEAQINLAYAALLISAYLTTPFETATYLAQLDKIAETIRPTILAAKTDVETIKRLNRYLFDHMKFSGNSTHYYQPDNSFLNKVLDLRTGIPISLSVVYLEIGRRLDLPLWGIGMPGHFIVGYGSPTDPIYIDVFNQGRILSEDDCFDICRVSPANQFAFRDQFLRPVTPKMILFRMLLNLKHIYVDWQDWQATYKIVDLMVIARPEEITELRDRGLAAFRLNRLQDAIFDLNRYLFLAPQSIEASWLKKQVKAMEEKLIQLN